MVSVVTFMLDGQKQSDTFFDYNDAVFAELVYELQMNSLVSLINYQLNFDLLYNTVIKNC